MEVGDEAIDHAKSIARSNQQPGLGRSGLNHTVGPSRAFQRSNHRGSHCPDPPTGAPNVRHGLSQLSGDMKLLSVHLVPARILHVHWLEGARTDLKIETLNADAGGLQVL